MADLAGGGVSPVGIGTNLMVITQLVASSGLAATDVGTPVKFTTTSNTVDKPADNDKIHGVMTQFEDRTQEGVKLATVSLMGVHRLKYKSGDSVAVGDSVVSAGAGEVKTVALKNNTRVLAKNATDLTVDVLFLATFPDTTA